MKKGGGGSPVWSEAREVEVEMARRSVSGAR